jgi:hypothetical protein
MRRCMLSTCLARKSELDCPPKAVFDRPGHCGGGWFLVAKVALTPTNLLHYHYFYLLKIAHILPPRSAKFAYCTYYA